MAPVHGSFPVSVALPSAAREQLAKDWVARIVDRTPLTELGSLPLRELAEEAPQLIATICAALAGSGPARELNETERAHVAKLATLRPGPDGPTRVSEDLAELQALLVRVIETSLGARASSPPARAPRLVSITGTHTAEGPRIAIAVGIVECPADGVSAERLLEGATEAFAA